MIKPRTVIVGYRKEASLKRLLSKILKSSKVYDDIVVTISLDGGASIEVKSIAEQFRNLIGEDKCEIIQQKVNLGLREHIIKCGDLTKQYESIILFEDDIYPDLHYFLYAQRSIEYFSKIDQVSQIALYSPRYNETANLPFTPASRSGKANYFMQIPCSWGQIWTRDQWHEFRVWYETNKSIDFTKHEEVPSNIAKWSEKSWKKYYAIFLLNTNRYTVYPYRAYSTNCGDPNGEHSGHGNHFLNTEIQDTYPSSAELNFVLFDQSSDKYDAFMEPHSETISNLLPKIYHDLSIDLYGTKPMYILNQKEYAITSKPTKNSLFQYPLTFKPLEKNLEFGIASDNNVSILNLTKVVDISQQKINIKRYGTLAQSLSYYPICTRKNIYSLIALKALEGINSIKTAIKRFVP